MESSIFNPISTNYRQGFAKIVALKHISRQREFFKVSGEDGRGRDEGEIIHVVVRALLETSDQSGFRRNGNFVQDRS